MNQQLSVSNIGFEGHFLSEEMDMYMQDIQLCMCDILQHPRFLSISISMDVCKRGHFEASECWERQHHIWANKLET